MIRTITLISCLLLPAMAVADLDLGTFKTFQTRFGTVGVVWRPEGSEMVLWNSNQIPDLETAEISIAGGYAIDGESHDWVLLNTRHGGNMCPYGFVVLKVGAVGVQRTQEFGGCLGPVRDIRVVPGQFEIDLGDGDIRYSHQTFTFDGAKLVQQPVLAAVPNQVAGAGVAVTRWIGKSLYDVLRDPAEVARFTTVMSPQMVEELRIATSLSKPSQLRGDWVIGTGCQSHLCNAVSGLWAIRVSDGTPIGVIVYGDGTPASVVGNPALLQDPGVATVLRDLQLRMMQ